MEQQQQHKTTDLRQAVNSVYAIACCLSACVLPFFRHRVGSHAYGGVALVGVVIMFVAGGIMNAIEMLTYMAAWLLATILVRLGVLRRWIKGEHLHSRYGGDSWFEKLPGVNENAAKGVIEPIACFSIGALLGIASPPLFQFLSICSIGLFVKHLIELEAVRGRVRQMRDNYIEQVNVRRRFRQGD